MPACFDGVRPLDSPEHHGMFDARLPTIVGCTLYFRPISALALFGYSSTQWQADPLFSPPKKHRS